MVLTFCEDDPLDEILCVNFVGVVVVRVGVIFVVGKELEYEECEIE